jgi:glycerophosphoryl diester phosphodiesterase
VTFFDRPGPLVFAHRGGCALGPENTIATFDAGLAAGADGLELDVHLSADGVLVVHHDATLDRTTVASGPLVSRTAAELVTIAARPTPMIAGAEAPARRDSLCDSLCVPTLAAVLARYPDIPIIIEMKVNTEEMGHALAREVQAAGAATRVCAAGFGLRSLRAAREALPQMASSASQPEVRLALYRSWIRWPVGHAAYGGFQVPEVAGGTRVVSPRFINDAHKAGRKVQVWTVDEEADMRRLLEWGADALISNRPGVAVRVRDEFLRAKTSRRS